MKTIPYHLFLNKQIRKVRESKYQDFYKQLVHIYVNRHVYDNGTKSPYLYRAQTTSPTEVIEPIEERFIYEYLLKNNPQALTYGRGNILTFEEYLQEIGVYFNKVEDTLLEGFPVSLPHFLGIIKVKIDTISKYNYMSKRKLPKKIITLQWEKRFFDARLLNVIKPEWYSIKIRNKNLLNKLYSRLISHEYLYSLGLPTNFSKKIR